MNDNDIIMPIWSTEKSTKMMKLININTFYRWRIHKEPTLKTQVSPMFKVDKQSEEYSSSKKEVEETFDDLCAFHFGFLISNRDRTPTFLMYKDYEGVFYYYLSDKTNLFENITQNKDNPFYRESLDNLYSRITQYCDDNLK
ncbi:MAG: hypothetical protein OQK82_03385 [Candidatus Pacearchaeota archaeon]|nr:hypothetical protein [Candidatus Pacearchaeota archaeon]